MPGISSPYSSTHQQYPVDPQHCSDLKLPSPLHWGTYAPTSPLAEAWLLSCSHLVAAVVEGIKDTEGEQTKEWKY